MACDVQGHGGFIMWVPDQGDMPPLVGHVGVAAPAPAAAPAAPAVPTGPVAGKGVLSKALKHLDQKGHTCWSRSDMMAKLVELTHKDEATQSARH